MTKIPKGEDLLRAWEDARSEGITRRKFAASLGISEKSLDNRLYKAKRRRRKKKQQTEEQPEETVTDTLDGNYRTITYQGVRHHCVEDLLEYLKVDLTEWRIDDRYEVGSWEMGRRAEQKNIRWEKGHIVEGFAEDSGKLYIDTLHRFKVPLVRINPKPLRPIVKPVRIEIPPVKTEHKSLGHWVAGLLIPDIQIGYRRNFRTGELEPFHDRAAMDIVLQVLTEYEFEQITLVGDYGDFTEWTDKFVKEPEFYQTAQPMVIEGNWFLAQIRARQPEATIQFIEGNHDYRIRRQMLDHLKAACGLKPSAELELEEPLSVQRLFGLDSLDIEYIGDYPNGEAWFGENFKAIHGSNFSSNPGGTVAKAIRDATVTTAFGHGHRLEMATKTADNMHGRRRYITAAMVGCLCHIDYRVPGHKRGQDWQQGFGVVHLHAQTCPRLELIPILDGHAVFMGREYYGHDYTDQLNADVKEKGWKF